MGEALRRPTSTDVSNPWLYQDDTWRPLFAQLRRDDPVHYCETSAYGPYWSVTRYDDIFAVELDHETYSSASELGGIQVADQPRGQERPNFIRMDPPGHTAQRKTVAPIVAPSQVPWGNKALGGYLSGNKQAWRKHDAVALIEDGARFSDLLVDYGDADGFLTEQLRPELLKAACEKADIPLTLRRQPGYDHSYYFISTFMADHLRWHAARLKA